MEWSRGPTIGRGSSATVSLASSSSGDLFAVKSAELSRSSLLQKEQSFLSQLSSPNVVQYLGFEITSEFNNPMYNLFMEYIPNGSISDKIKIGGSLAESTIQLYARQILIGLDYLHLNGLVHCDIKGENLLIGEDGIKIADLGCAKKVEDASEISGTPAFMAPEVARGEKQGFEADVWALGCTIIEMATGSHPWPESNNPVSTLYRIGFSGDVPESPEWFSDKAIDFLSKCLEKDCKQRWTVKQLLKHPFLDFLELGVSKSDESSSQFAHTFTENSPVSVLDQGFWESMEVSEDQRNLTHTSSSPNSPVERLMGLIGSNLPSWAWDEDWVTVRNKEIEEGSIIQEQNDRELTNDTVSSYMFSDVDLEDLGNSIIMNEVLLPHISVDTSGAVDCNYASTDVLMVFGSDEIVPVILILKRKLMEVMFLFNLVLALLLSNLPFSLNGFLELLLTCRVFGNWYSHSTVCAIAMVLSRI